MSKILQSNLCLNPDTGNFEVVRIESTISLDKNNNYIRSDDGSEKSLVDLGYIIENVDSAIFHINDRPLTKRFIEFAEELKNIEIANSEICIITNDNNFKSVICVASENILSSNTLTFNVDSYSSTVRASVLEDMNTIKLNTISETENIKNIAITEINNTKIEAIEETNNIKTDSIASINEIKTVSVAEISNTKTEAISETQNIKTLAIEEITNVAQTFKDYVDLLGETLKTDYSPLLLEKKMIFNNSPKIESLHGDYFLLNGQSVNIDLYTEAKQKLVEMGLILSSATIINLADYRGMYPRMAGVGVTREKGSRTQSWEEGNTDSNSVGTTQSDAIRDITGSWNFYPGFGVIRKGYSTLEGAFGFGKTYGNVMTGEYGQTSYGVDFKSSRVVSTADTNHPHNFTTNFYIYLGKKEI